MAKSTTSRLKIIQTLLDEHAAIKDALLILHHMTRQVAKRCTVSSRDLHFLTAFFREYADAIHHCKEEEVLFLAVHHSRTLRSMSQKLMTQHTIGRMFLGEMTEALQAADAGHRGWRKRFVENATAYHTLLTIHICDEDHIFFPRAEQSLRRANCARLRSRGDDQAKDKLLRRLYRLHRRLVLAGTGCSSCADTDCSPAGGNRTLCHSQITSRD